tara:strand:+ start:143 stop:427 length:285 start_codon:yes stop_codon:yes gene_type:complete
MKFPLNQLYALNRSKPIVEVTGIDGELQWDYCKLDGLPPETDGVSMHNHGKLPKGQYDNLPKTFYAINGGEYFIEYIYTLRPSEKKIIINKEQR